VDQELTAQPYRKFTDPLFNTVLPPEERATRSQLERIITSYFQGLTDHKPFETDYDTRCDRHHSGNRVTHNSRNGVEDSGDVGCYESNLGRSPGGPDRRMQINDFKNLDGRVRLIDNIGLLGQGTTTSGFTQ
jgi:hypothetical protein